MDPVASAPQSAGIHGWLLMSTKWRIANIACLLASLLVAAAGGVPDERLRVSASTAASLLSEAEIARDMAVRALENAFAARRDAENALLDALRTSREAECALVRAKLDQQNVAAASAAILAADVVKNAAISLVAADAVRAMVQQSLDQKPPRDPEDILKRTDKLLAEAERSLRKASAAAEILKRQWLLPVNLAPPPAAEKPAAPWWHFGR